jgi:hypothetical protein
MGVLQTPALATWLRRLGKQDNIRLRKAPSWVVLLFYHVFMVLSNLECPNLPVINLRGFLVDAARKARIVALCKYKRAAL